MIKYITFLFLLSAVIFANGRPTIEDKKIIDLSLNYKFEEADNLIADQFKIQESLKTHFIYLNVELIKVIKATDESTYNTRRAVKDSLNKKLIDYAETVIEEYEDKELSLYDKFYLGSIHGVLGRLYGVSKSMTSAFSSGKAGRNIMEEIIEEDPKFVDAYLLPGMLNYYADRLGGLTEFFAGILGLSGDRRVGLDYLEKVEKQGEFNNWQATMILIELYSRMEGNKFASLPLLKKMTEKFPMNTHFLNWYCYDLINLDQMEELERIINEHSDGINDFIKAAFYHNKGEFEKSNMMFDQLLNSNKFSYRGIYENSKYVRILNYYLLNDSNTAEELTKELNDDYKNRLKSALKNGIINLEFFNLKKAVSFNMENNFNGILDNDQKQSYVGFYTGVSEFKNNNLLKAISHFQKAKELNFDEYGYDSIRYLIHIFKNINVPIEEVEKLLDEIDDLDNDGLEFFAQDLEKKYNL